MHVLEFLFNIVEKETPTQVFSREYCESFKNTSGGCFCQFHKVTVQFWASADLLLLLKNKMRDGFYLLKRFVDLGRVCSLHINSRNHSYTFLLINMQKANTCSSKNYLLWNQDLDRFRQVFVHDLMRILTICKYQMATFIKLVSGEFPFPATYS